MQIICGIYKIVSPSGKVYIGQSVNIKERLRKYRYGAKTQRKLNNSILKYEWYSHSVEILCVCKEEELNYFEKHYAIVFDSYSQVTGMNIKECGGNQGRHSEETKKRMSNAQMGRKASDETKKRLSECQKGEKHYLYGKHLSPETKQKMSSSNKGKIFSETHRINLSESKTGAKNAMFGTKNTPEMRRVNSDKNARGNNANAKLVLNTETGIYYECSKDAWESFGRQSFEYFKFRLQGKFPNNTPYIYA